MLSLLLLVSEFVSSRALLGLFIMRKPSLYILVWMERGKACCQHLNVTRVSKHKSKGSHKSCEQYINPIDLVRHIQKDLDPEQDHDETTNVVACEAGAVQAREP